MIREDQYAGALMTIKSLQSQLEEAKHENAALRAENHLLRMKSGINVNQMYGVADAVRKEAQP